MSAANWEWVDDAWHHCGRPAWLDDEGATCSKCQASMTWADDVRYVVVSTSEDVSLRVDSSAYVVDLDGLADDERELLGDSDSFGWYGPEASAVVSRVGVPVSDVLAVWSAVQAAGVSLSELVALLSSRGVRA